MAKEFKEKMLLITYGIVLFIIVYNYRLFFGFIGKLLKICTPFFIGLVMAYVLNILVRGLENKVLNNVKHGKRLVSITLSLLIVIGFLIFLISILVPQIENAGTIFVNNLPRYQEMLTDFGNRMGISDAKLQLLDLSNNKLGREILSMIGSDYGNIINFSWGFASSIITTVFNIFIGLIFAIYILMDKERLQQQAKGVLKKITKEKTYNKICDIASLSDKIFSNFVKVQVLEAFILGSLCFIGMLILNIPYAATISVVVGFTALIPIFGSFVGLVIGTFLIFMINPIKALTFVIFLLILQQIENNLIYPKVVGGRIGLPSIWVLVAVTIGGGMAGVFGMIVGVPVVSIVYSLLRVSLKKKQIKVVE